MNELIYNYVRGKGWLIGTPPVWTAETKTRDGISTRITMISWIVGCW